MSYPTKPQTSLAAARVGGKFGETERDERKSSSNQWPPPGPIISALMATQTLLPSAGAQAAPQECIIQGGLLDCENLNCLPFPLSGGHNLLGVYLQTQEMANEFFLCILLFLAIAFYGQRG